MNSYEMAKTIYGMCNMDVTAKLNDDDAINSLAEAIDTLPSDNVLIYYLKNAMENMKHIKEKCNKDIANIIHHETAIFDPICDGPIEHAEGMEIAYDLIDKYFKGEIKPTTDEY